jgi:hypothetical protein
MMNVEKLNTTCVFKSQISNDFLNFFFWYREKKFLETRGKI